MTHTQVTESLDYLLEVKIARTMCKKISGENDNCLVQQDPKMQKVRAESRSTDTESTGCNWLRQPFKSRLPEIGTSGVLTFAFFMFLSYELFVTFRCFIAPLSLPPNPGNLNSICWRKNASLSNGLRAHSAALMRIWRSSQDTHKTVK